MKVIRRSRGITCVSQSGFWRCSGLSGFLALGVVILFTSTALAGNGTKKLTVKVTPDGGTEVTVTTLVDGGCSGDYGSELSRDTATKAGLIKEDGTFDKSKFETNADGSIKTTTAEQADGTDVKYAITKPIKVEATDDKGVKKEVSVRMTVIADPKKKGSDLLGRNWGAAAKVTETWANNKITFNNPSDEGKTKKEKSTKKSKVEPGSDFTEEYWDGVTFYGLAGSSMSQDTFLCRSSDSTMISQNMATTLGLTITGQVDLSDQTQLLDVLEKAGLYSESALPAVFNTALLPGVQVLTDDGTLLAGADMTVLINPASDQCLFGQDLLVGGLKTIGGVPLDPTEGIGYLHETEEFFFTPVPEPATLSLLILGGLAVLRRKPR